MASLPYLAVPQLAISCLSLIFFLCTLPIAISQDPTSSTPAIAQCAASLLPLAPCATFVQGITPTPPMTCCDNLKQLYTSVPNCLCVLLNGTTLRSFPINTTRALQVPDLCSLQVNISTCSGLEDSKLLPLDRGYMSITAGLSPLWHPSKATLLVPPTPPAVNTNSPISNATVWASPVGQPTPKPSLVGLGLGSISASFKPRAEIKLTVAIAMKTFMFLVVLY